jgi:DNA-binding MarR family transcriptional regulator
VAGRSHDDEPSLADHVCLVLVVQGVEHGWALGTLLAPGGDIGRIRSLSRPLTYRAVDQLVERALVRRAGTASGRAANRTVLVPTSAGRHLARRWLDEPAKHLRDVRTELMLKVVLRQRQGLPVGPLLASQEVAFAPIVSALVRSGRTGDLVDRWRAEHARAVQRFLRRAAQDEQA